MFAEIDMAIFATVDEYLARTGRNMRQLSEDMGINYNSFRRKVNRDKASPHPQHFTPQELIRLIKITGDCRVLRFINAECNKHLSQVAKIAEAA